MRLSKRDEAQIWDTMMERRRRLGPDPEDHPSIHRRMELEFVNICIIITWVLNKIPTNSGSIQATSGWRQRIAAILRHPLLMAAIFLSATIPTYLEVKELRTVAVKIRERQGREQVVGKAIINNPAIVTTIEGQRITITAKGGVTNDGKTTVLHLNNTLPTQDKPE